MRSTAIIILAAGNSSRLGRSKQLLDVGGKSLLTRTVEAAINSLADIVLVVLGSELETHKRELSDKKTVYLAHNGNWKKGMGASLKAGLKRLLELNPKTDDVIFSVCDQPYITSSIFNDLMKESQTSTKNVFASKYKSNSIGVPALFKSDLFSSLQSIDDKVGARFILKEKSADLVFVEFPNGDIDIDTLSDYHDIQAKFSEKKFL